MAINDIFGLRPGSPVPSNFAIDGYDLGQICKLVAARYCPNAVGVKNVEALENSVDGRRALGFEFHTPIVTEATRKAANDVAQLFADPFKGKVIEAAVPDLYARVQQLLRTINRDGSPTQVIRVSESELYHLTKEDRHERNTARHKFNDLYQLDPAILNRKIKATDFDPTGFLGEDYPRFRGPRSR